MATRRDGDPDGDLNDVNNKAAYDARLGAANERKGLIDAHGKKREALGDALGEAFLNWRMVKGTSARAQMARKQNLAKMAFVGLKAAFHEFTDPRDTTPSADAQQTGVHRPGGVTGLFNNIGGWFNGHVQRGIQNAPEARAQAESAISGVSNWVQQQTARFTNRTPNNPEPPPPSAS